MGIENSINLRGLCLEFKKGIFKPIFRQDSVQSIITPLKILCLKKKTSKTNLVFDDFKPEKSK